MIRCQTCCMPNTRPDTPFTGGICSACHSHAKRKDIDWDGRKKDLLALLGRHNGRCIVPSSGGKDSTFQVMTLKALGADVTVVTATTCHLTPIGRANIDNISTDGNPEVYKQGPRWRARRGAGSRGLRCRR